MSEITITIKASGDQKFTVSIDPSITVSALKDKIATLSEIPADSQRLIYSGKVLKDNDTIETYKIKDGHSIHLVKGASKSKSDPSTSSSTGNSSTTASSATTAAGSGSNTDSVPSNIAAGQGAFNPLAGLTGARYAGYNVPMPSASMFGPDGGMGPLPDASQLESMMDSPMFQESMRAMLSDPNMLDFVINQSPQLRAMGPQARQMLQSDTFRNMLSNPQMMRQMMEMQRMMGGAGAGGPFGGASGADASSFPAPGAASTDSTTADSTTTSDSTAAAAGAASTDSASAAAANPFAALFGGAGAGGAANPMMNPFANPFFQQAAGANATGDNASQQANPFMNPELLNMFLGGAGAGTGAAASAAAPVDNRPPEEVFENQLRQLNDMGFFDFDRNVTALRRSGGSVEGAIEALLNGTV
ncbi:unnamed protein product [[Candida] boidinii]|uniref:Unnamed protein product n=1 Tax=Candida boidinii TaxID=5477 RepID=A0ACB5TU02_CANBO|nr:unnamed protein product [[Candida] boidinii]